MGICSYVVCPARQDQFDLGKGWWSFDTEPIHQDLFVAQFVKCWEDTPFTEPDTDGYLAGVARTLWKWCDERNWQVELVCDAEDDHDPYYDYKVTGTRYKL